MIWWSAVVLSTLVVASAANAVPILLAIDAARSSIAQAAGPAVPLSGYLRLDVSSPPPNPTTVAFDLLSVDATAGGVAIRLDPAFENPGLGVLNAAGNFLIPNLHLVVESSATVSPLTLTGILGTFDPGDSCPRPFCLAVEFAIAGPGEGESTVVTVFAPEPGSWVLVLTGLAASIASGRRNPAIPGDFSPQAT